MAGSEVEGLPVSRRPARRRRKVAAGVSVSVTAQSYQPPRRPTSQSHCDVAPAATRLRALPIGGVRDMELDGAFAGLVNVRRRRAPGAS